jgi:hypothetical protein
MHNKYASERIPLWREPGDELVLSNRFPNTTKNFGTK